MGHDDKPELTAKWPVRERQAEPRADRAPEREAARPAGFGRKRLDWQVRKQTLRLGGETLLIAILDVSPDGPALGLYQDPDRARFRAVELVEQGAGIVELTAAPPVAGRSYVAEAEELRRLVPVLKRLRGQLGIPVAVETVNAGVAEKAVEYDADILHDPSGLIVQPALAKVAAAGNLGLLLTHMRGEPLTWPKMTPLRHAPPTIAKELNASVSRAIREGVDRRRLMIDPGLGQGKRKEQDLELLAYTGEISRLELPFCCSLSSPVAGIAGGGTLAAAVALAVRGGVHAVRTYDVALAKEAITWADAILSQ